MKKREHTSLCNSSLTTRHLFNTVQYYSTDDMGSCREIRYILLIVFAVSFLLSKCNALGLHNHSEIHEAKNLIDALYFKLNLQLQNYQQYVARSRSTQDEIKMLKKLKGLLNDLTMKSSICEKFYANFDFTVTRQIIIQPSSSPPKDFTYALQGTVTDVLGIFR